MISNKSRTALDLVEKLKPIKTYIDDKISNSENFQNFYKHITYDNFILFMLFLTLLYFASLIYFTYLYPKQSKEWRETQEYRGRRFIYYTRTVLEFIINSIKSVSLLILLCVALYFRNSFYVIAQVFFQFITYILSLITLNRFLKFILVSIIFISLCYIGKKFLERISEISNSRGNVNSLVNNKNDIINEMTEIETKINRNKFDIIEFNNFIKRNLLDYSNIKKTCEQDKKVLNHKITNLTNKITEKFKHNIDIYNIKYKTKDELDKLKQDRRDIKEKILSKRQSDLHKLQSAITYQRLDNIQKNNQDTQKSRNLYNALAAARNKQAQLLARNAQLRLGLAQL
tara:strand:- start:2189 stop:3217 length:1029 start_codon:yes stop_codon:yes gene_type:complete